MSIPAKPVMFLRGGPGKTKDGAEVAYLSFLRKFDVETGETSSIDLIIKPDDAKNIVSDLIRTLNSVGYEGSDDMLEAARTIGWIS